VTRLQERNLISYFSNCVILFLILRLKYFIPVDHINILDLKPMQGLKVIDIIYLIPAFGLLERLQFV
jgi:hypothetical protein